MLFKRAAFYLTILFTAGNMTNLFSKTISLADSIFNATVYSATGENWTEIQSNLITNYYGWENPAGSALFIKEFQPVGGVLKECLSEHPEWNPVLAATVAEFQVENPRTFSTYYGFGDGQIEGDARFIIQVLHDGIYTTLLDSLVADSNNWRYFIGDLSEWNNETVTLRFIIEPIDDPNDDWARWGNPTVITEGEHPAYLSASYTNLSTTYSYPVSDTLLTGLSNVRHINFHPNPFGNDEPALVATNYWQNGTVHLMVKSPIENIFEIKWTAPLFQDYGGKDTPRYVLFGDLDNDDIIEIIYPLNDLGILIYEWDGIPGSYNFGSSPSQIIQEPTLLTQIHGRIEYITHTDIDNDGMNELLFPYDQEHLAGNDDLECFYIISANGNWSTNAAGTSSFNREFQMQRAYYLDYGISGSPIAMIPADFDGDGQKEVLIHNWNFKNITILRVTGPDTYQLASIENGKQHLYLTHPNDDVALFGGIACDIDNDGRDEIYLPTTTPSWSTHKNDGIVHMISYDENQTLSEIDASNAVTLDLGSVGDDRYVLGYGIGDIDNDGKPNIYFSSKEGIFLVSAEFQGGDKKNQNNWILERLFIGSPTGIESGFAIIEDKFNNRDSIAHYYSGIVSKFHANYTDFDNDGYEDIIVPYQGFSENVDYAESIWDSQSGKFVTSRYASPNDKRWSIRLLEAKTPYTKSLSLISPNGSEFFEPDHAYGIAWNASFIDSILIEYSVDDGSNWDTIVSSFPARERHFRWRIPPGIASENCLVRITSIDFPVIADESNNPFTILENTAPSITLPALSDTVSPGNDYTFTPVIEDTEQENIQLTILEAPVWLSVVDNQILSGTPGNSGSGEFSISFRADDQYGGISDTSYILTVLNNQPPIPITDLQLIEEPGETTLWLKWTAPGSNWDQGDATDYDLRYSESPLTESNFSSAPEINFLSSPNSPWPNALPNSAGAYDSVQVAGLQSSTRYYFAIKSINSQGQESAISNVLSVITAGNQNNFPPDVITHGASYAMGNEAYQYNTTNTALAVGSEPITWSKVKVPDGFMIYSDGVISWTPTEFDAQNGSLLYIIRATNAFGSADDSVTVAFSTNNKTETVTSATSAQFLDFSESGVTMPDFENNSDLSGAITVSEIDTIPENPGAATSFDFGNQYWVVDSSVPDNAFSTTLVFYYDESQLEGISENELIIAHRENEEEEWTAYPVQHKNTDENTVTLLNVNQFSMFSTADDLLATAVQNKIADVPSNFYLHQNYPNPFNPVTTIAFEITETQYVTVKIYNINGRLIQTLMNQEKAAGIHRIVFDGTNLVSGIYFYTVQAGQSIATKKMLLVK
ncbi:MAG: T9SS C-terminal target domain-containing protein [Calditrichaeota bacterium]|nr:MAG: T9SS C-terminal target domain-containing protein [Calditrichota bacterium]